MQFLPLVTVDDDEEIIELIKKVYAYVCNCVKVLCTVYSLIQAILQLICS